MAIRSLITLPPTHWIDLRGISYQDPNITQHNITSHCTAKKLYPLIRQVLQIRLLGLLAMNWPGICKHWVRDPIAGNLHPSAVWWQRDYVVFQQQQWVGVCGRATSQTWSKCSRTRPAPVSNTEKKCAPWCAINNNFIIITYSRQG